MANRQGARSEELEDLIEDYKSIFREISSGKKRGKGRYANFYTQAFSKLASQYGSDKFTPAIAALARSHPDDQFVEDFFETYDSEPLAEDYLANAMLSDIMASLEYHPDDFTSPEELRKYLRYNASLRDDYLQDSDLNALYAMLIAAREIQDEIPETTQTGGRRNMYRH
jgi:hypothetical protein